MNPSVLSSPEETISQYRSGSMTIVNIASTLTLSVRIHTYGFQRKMPTTERTASACVTGLRTKFDQRWFLKTTTSSLLSRDISMLPSKPRLRKRCRMLVATSSHTVHWTFLRNTISSNGFSDCSNLPSKLSSSNERLPVLAMKGDRSKATSNSGHSSGLGTPRQMSTNAHRRLSTNPRLGATGKPTIRKLADLGCSLNDCRKSSTSFELQSILG
mmetsp:Transcript_44941/g.82080  ORF Transcript_44941/g.82080 Transcript_44941/m.82080 type:complete len:214 (-) Transcript_44941:856-1497(-)